ncbi:MAG: serine protease [Bacteroidetes bacterium MED-G17]|nr:MAG: serine protease [Bacteroidetes bacterium MED-G17]|tara:strand:- start:2051 stop:3460 length:1410 start_codon:yes stop_codon:yes gene_type:complete
MDSKFIVTYLFFCLSIFSSQSQTKEQFKQGKIVKFDIKEPIAPSASRITSKAIAKAKKINAHLILIHMNTYGGLVTDADSIRSSILASPIPVYVFIDNNAASAGALISIACDKIFMTPGANIGAATVVNQSGEAAPDKYQSYMRGQMRSTAEAQGKDTFKENGKVVIKYKRNPQIAQAMVDEDIEIKGISPKGEVITFTTQEAIKYGFCDGSFESINEMLKSEGFEDYKIQAVEKNTLDKLIGFLANPAFRSILILVILGGIYFELQTPGVGFPILAALIAAVLYFAPLYLDGLASNWEIALFFFGLIFMALEVFVIPGFGLAGVVGIVFMVSGLSLAMVQNVNFDFSLVGGEKLSGSVLMVLASFLVFILLLLLFGYKFFNSKMFNRIALTETLENSKVPENKPPKRSFINHVAETIIDLRPQGKVILEGQVYLAKSNINFIPARTKVKILGLEGPYLVVMELKDETA